MDKPRIHNLDLTFENDTITACFWMYVSDKLVRTVIILQVLYSIFRNISFVTNVAKINVIEIFKYLYPCN